MQASPSDDSGHPRATQGVADALARNHRWSLNARATKRSGGKNQRPRTVKCAQEDGEVTMRCIPPNRESLGRVDPRAL